MHTHKIYWKLCSTSIHCCNNTSTTTLPHRILYVYKCNASEWCRQELNVIYENFIEKYKEIMNVKSVKKSSFSVVNCDYTKRSKRLCTAISCKCCTGSVSPSFSRRLCKQRTFSLDEMTCHRQGSLPVCVRPYSLAGALWRGREKGGGVEIRCSILRPGSRDGNDKIFQTSHFW